MSIARMSPLLLFLCACREPVVDEHQLGGSWATHYCGQLSTCHCPWEGYASREQCEVDVAEFFEEARRTANVAGLTYDGECAAQRLAEVTALGCEPATEPPGEDPSCVRECATYHGDADIGERCEEFAVTGGQLSSCRSGLRCKYDGEDDAGAPIRVCEDPCADDDALTVGMPCVVEDGEDLDCADGLECFRDSGVCEPPRGVSRPCGTDAQCEGELWCPDQDSGFTGGDEPEGPFEYRGVCSRPKDLDESCDDDGECTSGFCDDDRCARAAELGEPCDERCVPGANCTADDRPEAAPDARICKPDEAIVCRVSPNI
jgi:hypothetical protein